MTKKNNEKKLEACMTIDALDLYCPMPVVKLKIGLHEIEENGIIKILADDPGFEEDVKQWCSNTGNILLHMEKNDYTITAFVKKTAK